MVAYELENNDLRCDFSDFICFFAITWRPAGFVFPENNFPVPGNLGHAFCQNGCVLLIFGVILDFSEH